MGDVVAKGVPAGIDGAKLQAAVDAGHLGDGIVDGDVLDAENFCAEGSGVGDPRIGDERSAGEPVETQP